MQHRRITDVVSRDELRPLLEVRDSMGWLAVGRTWGLIAAALALAAWHPTWWTVALALVVVGAQQHALAVVMHEGTHGVLFRDRRLNDAIGTWLCGNPIWLDHDEYRASHLAHHSYTGTGRDPDRAALRDPYPRTRASMVRKLLRDASGVTGLKRLVGLLLMELGVIEFNTNGEVHPIDQRGRTAREVLRAGARNLAGVATAQAAIAGILALAGHAWLYAIWAGAWLTVYGVCLRLRSIGDHACTPHATAPFLDSRTTYPGPLARLLVAPFHVSYHVEHHAVMTVPWYHLPALHALLRERGAIHPGCLSHGFGEVLRLATSATVDPERVPTPA